MTTRAKCLALAQANQIEIVIHNNFGYEYALNLPKGLQLEDYDGSRTGLCRCDIPNKKELWILIAADLGVMISHKPWPKVAQ
jgi:hypothetical protein